ncbi:MAG: MarR family transcriptional regulator [Paracoccus sp. (in: a-proteobacteria)]|nr:MarR family transcriptional regulator [Paracoccus sp. (in: a-proteobacteria)]
MDDTRDFDLARFTPFRLARIAEHLGSEVSAVYRARHGIGRAEWRVLAHLGANGANTARDLQGLTAMDKVKVSRAVAALEARGWLRRRLDETDRRISHLTLTEQGQAVFAGLAPAMLRAEARAIDGLDGAQKARLGEMLDDLERIFGLDAKL